MLVQHINTVTQYQNVLPVIDVSTLEKQEAFPPGVEEMVPQSQEFDVTKLLDYHRKVGHLNFDQCYTQLKMKHGSTPTCPDCLLTKMPRLKYIKETSTRASLPLYRLFIDLSGRKRASLAGFRYYMIVVDDCSRKRWVFNSKQKSEAFTKIKEFITQVERLKPGLKVAKRRTDGGGEFISVEFQEYCKQLGITRKVSAPYCQYQNGVVERSMGIINSASLALMSTASSPTYDWPFAVQYAAFLLNYASTQVEGVTQVPNSLFDGVERKVKFKGIFVCLVYAKVYVRGKQENQSRRAVFLGCSETYKAIVVRDISTYTSSHREYYARDVVFDVGQFPYQHALVPRPATPPLDRQDQDEVMEIMKERKEAEEAVPLVKIDGNEDGPILGEVLDKGQDELDEKHVETDHFDESYSQAQSSLQDEEEPQGEEIFTEPPDLPEHSTIRRNKSRAARGTSTKALENMYLEQRV